MSEYPEFLKVYQNMIDRGEKLNEDQQYVYNGFLSDQLREGMFRFTARFSCR
jgi:hypothetical protein